jgi:hypothetical protein
MLVAPVMAGVLYGVLQVINHHIDQFGLLEDGHSQPREPECCKRLRRWVA